MLTSYWQELIMPFLAAGEAGERRAQQGSHVLCYNSERVKKKKKEGKEPTEGNLKALLQVPCPFGRRWENSWYMQTG